MATSALLLLLVLCCTATSYAQQTLAGKWAGSGHMRINHSGAAVKFCPRSTLVINETTEGLGVEQWDNCIVDWSVQPLTFKAGEIFYRERRIGVFTAEALHFEYRSVDTGYYYEVDAFIKDGKLVIDELIDLPKIWWSQSRYVHRRQN